MCVCVELLIPHARPTTNLFVDGLMDGYRVHVEVRMCVCMPRVSVLFVKTSSKTKETKESMVMYRTWTVRLLGVI